MIPPTHAFQASPQTQFPYQSGAGDESPITRQNQETCVSRLGLCRALTTRSPEPWTRRGSKTTWTPIPGPGTPVHSSPHRGSPEDPLPWKGLPGALHSFGRPSSSQADSWAPPGAQTTNRQLAAGQAPLPSSPSGAEAQAAPCAVAATRAHATASGAASSSGRP